MDRLPPTTNLRFMSFFYGLTAGLSSLIIVLILVWAFHFRDGFGWQSNPQLEFNWHPLLMVLSLVVLYGHGNTRIRRQQMSPVSLSDNVPLSNIKVNTSSIVGVFFFSSISADFQKFNEWKFWSTCPRGIELCL
jgi:hypothetical protein